MLSPLRVFFAFALSALLVAVLGTGDVASPLARHVPADVGLYVEGRQLDDLLLALTEPQAWLTLAELAGQPAKPGEAAEWRAQLARTLHMDPAEAIRVLCAQQFAFVGEGPGRVQDAVVLCRPAEQPRALVERWKAQPLPSPGRTPVYRLPNRIGVALTNGFVVFGDAAPTDGMFNRVLAFNDRGGTSGSLATDPIYTGLLARAPANPDAILFARLRGAAPNSGAPNSGPAASTSQPRTGPTPASLPASAPAGSGAAVAPASAPVELAARGPELPGPLRGAKNILLALHREGDLLHFSAVSDASPAAPAASPSALKDLTARLPATSLLVWGTRVDFPGLIHSIDSLPQRSVARLTLRMQERAGVLQRLAEAFGSVACLAIGTVDPVGRTRPAPPAPAAALLVEVENAATVTEELDQLLQASVSMYNLLALNLGRPLKLEVPFTVELGGHRVQVLDLSPVVRAGPLGEALSEIHICWTIDGDVLIVATHFDWLQAVLAARHGTAPPLTQVLQLSRRPVADACETIIAVQPGPIADLGEMWLAHLIDVAPQVLEENWWRGRQPGGGVRLGIQVTESAEQRRLQVASVEAGGAADGLLRPGDAIIGHHARAFATTQPIVEIREAIAHRPNAGWVELLIERGGTRLVRRIPVGFVDPVQMLRRAVAVGRIAQRLVYHEDAPEAAGARGYLTVELRRSAAPLFTFALTPAATLNGSPAESAGSTTSPAETSTAEGMPVPPATIPAPASAPARTPATGPAGMEPDATPPAEAPLPVPASAPAPASGPSEPSLDA